MLGEEKGLVRSLGCCHVHKEAAQGSLSSEAEEERLYLDFGKTEDILSLLHFLLNQKS